MTLLLESAMRVSAVILLSLAVAALLRSRSAALRHWILAAGLIAAIAMPALQSVAPRWGMPRTPVHTLVGSAIAAAPAAADQPLGAVTRAVDTITAGDAPVSIVRVASWIWMAGLAIGLALLCAGFARLAWIASRCEPVIERRWTTASREVAAHLGLHRDIVLLRSTHDSLLVTWGHRCPKIILPAGALDWSEDRIRIVLGHELSHARRGDWLLQVIGSLLRAVYWFNPLVWIACHWLRHESERACDDDVLSLGTAGHDYATELLDIARTLRRPAWSPAPGMARPSSLHRRVRAMLNTNIDRSPLSPALRTAIAAATLSVAVIVAGSSAAAQAVGAAFSGSFVDALNNAIPDVTMTLTNTATGEEYRLRSDAEGRFTLDALPDGDYRGEVNAAGFTSIHPFLRIKAGTAVIGNVIPLPLGTVEETITVRNTPPAPAPAVVDQRARVAPKRDVTAPILPPLKLRDVRPLYPPNRTDEEATIFLEGIIDTIGLMKGLQVMQPANEDFARAALDAVKDWQFEPTRLHGVPVDTAIHVTVRFLK
jgi:beta-lactamase regulating signal transducer with metallopeptidase domain